jgi:cytoskeletal protein CcmA (bactofilin family)
MNKIETPIKISGFIDRDTEITGEIKFKENFRIDGVFKGKILSGNGLIIGESGEVEADIDVITIAVNGRVKGTIKAKERIEIFAKGSCQMEMKALEGKTREAEAKTVK